MISRRRVLFSSVASAVGAALLGRQAGAATATSTPRRNDRGISEGHTPVVTPNGSSLPWRWEDGRKTFHLIAEPLVQEFAPGLRVNCWGYNGHTPGPTIEAVEGDRVRIYLENRLPEPTSMHWHGVLLPNGMDGVVGLNQPRIEPGETFRYEFEVRQHGTQMYHPHFDEMVQQSLGMMGFLVFHPKAPTRRIDRDFAVFLHEWLIKPGTSTPDPTEMLDFNVFTFNSKVFPATEHLLVRQGDRVRIRIANISMDSHPIHVHGHRFFWTGSDGGPLPQTAWIPETTMNVAPGTTRDIEFVADNPGDWALHCHKVHHTMNQMGHKLPILLGVDTSAVGEKLERLAPGTMTMGNTGMGDMMDMGRPRNTLLMGSGEGPFGQIFMGGMFTVVKVRPGVGSYDGDPGWYSHPAGTLATKVDRRQASAAEPAESPARVALSPGTFEALRASSCAAGSGGNR